MASMKAKKGNPFEREVAYNFQELGFKVTRLNDNTPGVDLIAENGEYKYAIECKCHKGFTWNELEKVYTKTATYAYNSIAFEPLLIFKGNRQPVLVMREDFDHEYTLVTTFTAWMFAEWKKVPKGWKVWK